MGTRVGDGLGMLPLATLLRETARRDPGRVAIVTERAAITYRELDDRVDRLANALRGLGLARGGRVAVMATDSIEHAQTAYAIARAGGVYVPLNYRLRQDEVEFLLSDSEPRVFCFGEGYREIAEAVRARVAGVEHLVDLDGAGDGDVLGVRALIDAAAPGPCDVDVDPDDVLQIQYSSGTTGLPKGAVLTHRILTSRIAIGLAESPRRVDDVYFNAAPFFHVAGSQIDYMMHVRGGTVVRHKQFEPEAVARALVDQGVTVAFFVPSMINFLLQVPGIESSDFSRLRLIEYGAAPMPQGLLRRAMATFGCEFAQLFGAGTEGGLQSILPPEEHRPDGGEREQRRLRSIGRPAMFTEVRVVDEHGAEVRPGEVGEIISRGPSVMREYWRKPEATAETVRHGWLHAGDMGTVDEDGYIYLVDRKKDMIIRGGENIYPAEVELVLADHPDVLEVAVVGVPDETWGEAVKAIAVRRPGTDVSEDDLIEYCRERMASYKKPTSVDFVDALPRNASGKVLKRSLRAPYWQAAGRAI